MVKVVILLTAHLAIVPARLLAADSTCFGTVSNGRLEDGVSLPASGGNFVAYSTIGHGLGRTYVHSKVREIVLAAYEALAESAPGKKFVYGETGWASGGRFRPHRTHQNGLSVDFMVPVLDEKGSSVPLPTSVFNRFGYDIEFDGEGRYGDYAIDFEAMAAHLHQLSVEAKARGAEIALVIFDPQLRPRLLKAKSAASFGPLNFMKGQAWVRHDEHYHVDFAVPCKGLTG